MKNDSCQTVVLKQRKNTGILNILVRKKDTVKLSDNLLFTKSYNIV